MVSETQKVQCPYCWEIIEVLIDCSVLHQHYIEDCTVCCRPIHFDVTISQHGEIEITSKGENES